MFKEIGIFVKENSAESTNNSALDSMISCILSCESNLCIDESSNYKNERVQALSHKDLVEKVDLIIVFGGDGTLLNSARQYLDSQIPSFSSRNGNRITYIDLFCGGGGLSLGVHHALHKFGFDAKLLLAADTDKKALRLIKHTMIFKKFPNDSIIGEEFEDKHSSSKYKWSVDPIDGTRAFVIGAPTWSNLISLSFKNKSFLGLANFPELNKYYINDKKKSYVYKERKKFILKSSNNNNLKTIKIIGNFHGTLSYEKQRKVIKKFGWSFRLAGFDALNYCLLAEGKVDAVIEANLKPYDILPLIPIIKNSGAIVSNWKNDPAENGGNILATSNRKLHNKILKLLKPFTKK